MRTMPGVKNPQCLVDGDIEKIFILPSGLYTNQYHKAMSIEEAQKIVDTWIQEIGVRYYNELTNTAILMEEVGELARIMARVYGEQSFKQGESHNLADEMADVLFVLICLANQTGVSLTEALQKNLEKKTRRDRERHRNNEKLQ